MFLFLIVFVCCVCVCLCLCVFVHVCLCVFVYLFTCLFFPFVSSSPPLQSEEKLRNQSKIHQDIPARQPLSLPNPRHPPPSPSPRSLFPFLCCKRLEIGWDVRLAGIWSGADMNCVSLRQERSSPLALTQSIALLSDALVHLPTANGRSGGRDEGRERTRWKRREEEEKGKEEGEKNEKKGSMPDRNPLFLIPQLGQGWMRGRGGGGGEREGGEPSWEACVRVREGRIPPPPPASPSQAPRSSQWLPFRAMRDFNCLSKSHIKVKWCVVSRLFFDCSKRGKNILPSSIGISSY